MAVGEVKGEPEAAQGHPQRCHAGSQAHEALGLTRWAEASPPADSAVLMEPRLAEAGERCWQKLGWEADAAGKS
jgi:hypothetical protein